MVSTMIHIGTSGWHYEHWVGPFYPPDTPSSDYLPFYAARFQSVEINSSFYHLPKKETFAQWRETVPEGFLFVVKASRYITHMKKLKDSREPLANFLEPVQALRDKLGPLLFQLPPRWRANPERLEAFLEVLPVKIRAAFEFRDPSWFDDRVYAALEKHNAAFCIYEFDRRISPKQITADFVYVRLHGPEDAYQGSYSTQQLSGWAGAFSTWSNQGKEIFCFFDNDQAGYAVQNALELKNMLIPEH